MCRGPVTDVAGLGGVFSHQPKRVVVFHRVLIRPLCVKIVTVGSTLCEVKMLQIPGRVRGESLMLVTQIDMTTQKEIGRHLV